MLDTGRLLRCFKNYTFRKAEIEFSCFGFHSPADFKRRMISRKICRKCFFSVFECALGSPCEYRYPKGAVEFRRQFLLFVVKRFARACRLSGFFTRSFICLFQLYGESRDKASRKQTSLHTVRGISGTRARANPRGFAIH